MERRTVLAMILSLAVWYGWLMMFPPEMPPEETDGTEEQAVADVEAAVPVASPSVSSAATKAPHVTAELEACDATQTWNSDAGLGPVYLSTYKDAIEVTPIYSWLIQLVTGPREGWKPYGTDSGPAIAVSETGRVLAPGSGSLQSPYVQMVRQDAATPRFRGVTASGVTIEQSVTPWTNDDGCAVDVEVTWTNDGSSTTPVWIAAHDVLGEAGWNSRYGNIRGIWAMVDDTVENQTDLEAVTEADLPTELEGEVQWFGLADRYFTSLIMPLTGTEGAALTYAARSEGDVEYHGAALLIDELAPGATHTATFRLYAGAKSQSLLAAVDPRLEEVVELGWFAFAAAPLQWLLETFHSLSSNWGIAIILLTLTVKAVFFPLSQRAFKSTQAMQAIQPQMNEIRELYKDDPERQQRETMKLFTENGVNPLGGCLPMLLQMPVFFALYSVLLSSTDLYQADFLYLQDLSSPDPYGVLPVLLVVVMWGQQQFMMPKSSGPKNPTQEMQMRMMKFMPLFFGVLNFTFPSGVVLYIFVNVSLSVLQQWVIRRTYQAPTVGVAGATVE